MKGILLKFVVIGLSLFVADWLLQSIHFADWKSIIIAAIVFGLINAFFKPILVILTLPITFLTLGLFLLVINIVLYWLTAEIVTGFEIDGWAGVIAGAVVTWVVSFILNKLIKK